MNLAKREEVWLVDLGQPKGDHQASVSPPRRHSLDR